MTRMTPEEYREEHLRQGLPWSEQSRGPDPITVFKMSRMVLHNITCHLANEHKVNPDKIPSEQRDWRHALAHMYGEFRPGQEHYHERPKQ